MSRKSEKLKQSKANLFTMLALDWQIPYKPEKSTNAQLADDFRLFVAAVANLDAGKDEPFTYEDIIKWAVSCVKEIAKRMKTKDMKYSISKEKSEYYEKLWNEVIKKLSEEEITILAVNSSDSDSQAIYLVSPHAELISARKKTLIIKSRDFSQMCEKKLIFCSSGLCFGTLKMKLPRKCPLSELEELYPLHRITPAETKEWWPDVKEFYCYDIYDVVIWDASRHAEIPQGVQTFIKKVKFLDSEELAPVNPSGIELGEEITREDIMPYFKSFYRTKPYVSLIGGICTQGKTKGDIDFFINSNFRDIATEFRLVRMFPQEFWYRFRFTYPFQQETHPGKFTSHLDIYDEKIEVVSKPELVLMSVPKKVELFKFAFRLLKPAHGHYKGEEYSVDKLIEVANAKPEWYDKGIYVEKKFDGVHLRNDHSKDGKVVIWSEEGNELTKNLPSIEKELKEICTGHDIVLAGELESWEKGKHQARQLTTSIIHTKEVHEKEPSVRLNIFDCLYYDNDIHNEPYSERLKVLAKIKDAEHIKKADYKLVHSPTELRKAVEHYASLPGSEGAYLKRADFFYELDGKTLLNLKYKNTYSMDVEVVKVYEVKKPS